MPSVAEEDRDMSENDDIYAGSEEEDTRNHLSESESPYHHVEGAYGNKIFQGNNSAMYALEGSRLTDTISDVFQWINYKEIATLLV